MGGLEYFEKLHLKATKINDKGGNHLKRMKKFGFSKVEIYTQLKNENQKLKKYGKKRTI